MLFKKEQRSCLRVGVPPRGWRIHSADLARSFTPAWQLVESTGQGGICGLALAVHFCFQRASGPGHFYGNQEEAAGLPAVLTAHWEKTCRGDCWPLFWGSKGASFQKALRRLLQYADLEGLTVMEEILLQQEIEWIKWRAWRRLDAFSFVICSILFGPMNCYLRQMPERA